MKDKLPLGRWIYNLFNKRSLARIGVISGKDAKRFYENMKASEQAPKQDFTIECQHCKDILLKANKNH